MPFIEIADYPVVLDACVLLPMPLADTLLRLAETPRLYLPKWTDQIMNEVSRNLISRWSKNEAQIRRREKQLREAFPEAWVEGYEPLIQIVSNHAKDRHVLAAAIKANSGLIVTYNAKDFPPDSLAPWNIELQGPSTFLSNMYEFAPDLVLSKLGEQAGSINSNLETLLSNLRVNAPAFVNFLCEREKFNPSFNGIKF